MEAVDSAAAVGGSTDSDSYLADWNNEVTEIPDGDMVQPVENMASELEASFDSAILKDYVANAGYKPT